MYGLDLMGTDSWGGDGTWGGVQAWQNLDYGNDQRGEYEGTGYPRSLATLCAVPTVSVKNSSDALADRHARPVDVPFRQDRPSGVPITYLIVAQKLRIKHKTKNKQKLIDNRSSSSCVSSLSCCSTCPSTAVGAGRCPSTPLKMGGDPKLAEFIANRNPELATYWTKHKAITNYETYHMIGVDMGRDYVTPIEIVANSSLGIDGWALFDVDLMDESSGAAVLGGSPGGSSEVLYSCDLPGSTFMVSPVDPRCSTTSGGDAHDRALPSTRCNRDTDSIYVWRFPHSGTRRRAT